MKKKKILAIGLAFILLVTALIVTAVANTKTTDVEIIVDKAALAPGEAASVSVKVTTNYPVATMSIPVFYDKTKVDVSEATATLTGYSVATATTDSQSADTAKVYNNTQINSSEFGFVLVNYIGAAGQELADSVNSVVLTFKITAKANATGSTVIKTAEESEKTDENPAGMLYFGAPSSGKVIDEIPQNVENIDLTLANKEIICTGNHDEHSFGEWTTTIEPTCETTGKKTRKCYCGATETETIPALGHDFDEEFTVDIEATYEKDGSKSRHCSRCDEVTDVTVIPKLEAVNNGWTLENGKWAYYENGVKLTNQWKKDSKGWCYLGADGYMATNKWIRDSKGWCYVGADGYCVTNQWVKDSHGWCYLDANGRMATNKWIKDSVGWCYVGADGYCVTNKWVKDSHGWCYLDANGRMATNKWIKDSVGWCYVGADGYCVTNAWKADSKGWCYLDANGRMMTNSWLQWNGNWYYLDENGYMVTGTKVINGKTYKFNSNGVWIG